MLRLSIVIPTLNNNDYLMQCISEVKKNTTPDTYEIILCDNANSNDLRLYAQHAGLKYVAFETNVGFGKACNAGARLAEGEYICFLNDDALVTPDWDNKLISAFIDIPTEMRCGTIGAVGPVSNYVAGLQQVKSSSIQFMPQNKDEVSKKLPRQFALSGFLSGFCVLLPRQLFFDAGLFDERFFSGFEDNALALTLNRMGYKTGIVGNCFVYHYGSQTLRRPEFSTLQLGTGQRELYNDLYKDTRPQKLATAYRVKIDTDSHEKYFLMSLKRAVLFSDYIIIGNDRSTKDLNAIVSQLNTTTPVIVFDITGNERDQRNQIIKYALEKTDSTWFLCLDADEVVEDKVDRPLMEKLMYPADPAVASYIMHWYTLWNSEKYWRMDDVWGQQMFGRMSRLYPNNYLFAGDPEGNFHVGAAPYFTPDVTRVTGIRVKHYGYVDPDERQKKYEWYTRTDTVKIKELIGHENYDHLINESTLRLVPWQENQRISLYTIVKNEERLIPQFVDQFGSFVDEIVLLDTGSTDDTKRLATKYGIKLVEHQWKDSFSEARNEGLKYCTGEWIFHLDLDEVVPKIHQIRRLTEFPNADGFMFNVRNVLKTGEASLSETVRLYRRNKNFYYTGYVHETLDEASKNMKAKIYQSQTEIVHYGYLKPIVKEKLKYYMKLNEMQMNDFPDDARPPFNLALHHLDAGDVDKGVALLRKSVELNPEFYQPKKELALVYMRMAYELLEDVHEILPAAHPMSKVADEMLGAMHPYAGQPRTSLHPEHVEEVEKEKSAKSA